MLKYHVLIVTNREAIATIRLDQNNNNPALTDR